MTPVCGHVGGGHSTFQYGMLCVSNIRKHEHYSSVSPNFLESFLNVLVWERHHLLSKSHPSTLSVSHLLPPFLPTFSDSKKNQVHKESKLCCMTSFCIHTAIVSAILNAKLGYRERWGERGREGRRGRERKRKRQRWGCKLRDESVMYVLWSAHKCRVIFNSRVEALSI